MIEKELGIQQYRKLNREADNLYDLDRKLNQIKFEFTDNWTGVEADLIYKNLEDVSYILKCLNQDLVEFGYEYLKLLKSGDSCEG